MPPSSCGAGSSSRTAGKWASSFSIPKWASGRSNCESTESTSAAGTLDSNRGRPPPQPAGDDPGAGDDRYDGKRPAGANSGKNNRGEYARRDGGVPAPVRSQHEAGSRERADRRESGFPRDALAP